jgi:hypothetical protein
VKAEICTGQIRDREGFISQKSAFVGSNFCDEIKEYKVIWAAIGTFLPRLQKIKISNVRINKVEARSCNHCYSGTAVSTVLHILSVWLYSCSGIRRAKCMRHIIMLFVSCLAVQYTSTLFHKQTMFEKF